jgi:hypothetical protein
MSFGSNRELERVPLLPRSDAAGAAVGSGTLGLGAEIQARVTARQLPLK